MFPSLVRLSRPTRLTVRPTLVQRGYASSWTPPCLTWIDKNTRVITQGFTGKQVRVVRRTHSLATVGGGEMRIVFLLCLKRFVLHQSSQHCVSPQYTPYLCFFRMYNVLHTNTVHTANTPHRSILSLFGRPNVLHGFTALPCMQHERITYFSF